VRRSTLVIGAGSVILAVGAAVSLAPWLEAYRWQTSPVAQQAERNAAAPLVVPPRATPTPFVRQATPSSDTRSQLATPAAAVNPTAAPPEVQVAVPTETLPHPLAAAPTPTLAPSNLQLADAAFQFLDSPQPGATARLSVSIRNPTDEPGGPVSLDLPLAWLKGYAIEGVVPLPTDGRIDGQRVESNLRITVDGPAARDALDLSVFVVTTDEVIDAPSLRILDAEGREIGRAHPPTEAPRPEPGPVYAVDIPNLRLHTGVVQVDWEPPLFVVGQVRGSAYVMQGNSVLVGHVRGAAGYNVFDHLDKVAVGDPIVASSRGADYPFVVTHIDVLPADDTSPTLPSATPRLTLMTCTGDFNPLTGEYPDRLWVIAEPADVVNARSSAPAAMTSSARLQPAGPGGLGNTDTDLAVAYRGPIGESRTRLAVYRGVGVEHAAQLVDVPGTAERRAITVVERTRTDAPLSIEDAERRARALLPRDATPRSAGADGNSRFAVEYFTSGALERSLPPEWFTDGGAQPGDLVAVYKRRGDGRVTDILVGIGNDASAMLALLDGT
jgi:sortase (surface protein transpeptidase)